MKTFYVAINKDRLAPLWASSSFSLWQLNSIFSGAREALVSVFLSNLICGESVTILSRFCLKQNAVTGEEDGRRFALTHIMSNVFFVTFTHLKLVFMLLVHLGQQLGFAPVQGVDQGVALRHQTGLKFHAVFLRGENKTTKNTPQA